MAPSVIAESVRTWQSPAVGYFYARPGADPLISHGVADVCLHDRSIGGIDGAVRVYVGAEIGRIDVLTNAGLGLRHVCGIHGAVRIRVADPTLTFIVAAAAVFNVAVSMLTILKAARRRE